MPATLTTGLPGLDKVLKGARPAELPMEQPTRFELVLNARAAKALGLALPASFLARADDALSSIATRVGRPSRSFTKSMFNE